MYIHESTLSAICRQYQLRSDRVSFRAFWASRKHSGSCSSTPCLSTLLRCQPLAGTKTPTILPSRGSFLLRYSGYFLVPVAESSLSRDFTGGPHPKIPPFNPLPFTLHPSANAQRLGQGDDRPGEACVGSMRMRMGSAGPSQVQAGTTPILPPPPAVVAHHSTTISTPAILLPSLPTFICPHCGRAVKEKGIFK